MPQLQDHEVGRVKYEVATPREGRKLGTAGHLGAEVVVQEEFYGSPKVEFPGTSVALLLG